MYTHYIVGVFFLMVGPNKMWRDLSVRKFMFYNIKKMVHYQKSLACPLLVPIQLNFALELHFSYSFIISR